MDNSEAFETANFWYEIETSEKGEQVSKLWLNADNIPQSHTHELCDLIQKVERIWKNVSSPKPSWLDLVTIELVGVDRRHELSVERDNLESQLRAAEEERRREAARRESEIARMAKDYELTKMRQDGSGISLTLTKRLLEAQSGRIEVESILGRGTTFRVCLPLAEY